MSIDRHSLVNEFPEYRNEIHQLKTSNMHFSKLFHKYDEIDHAIWRIESGAEAASGERLEVLKKLRLTLKDELFVLLKNVAA